MSPPPPVAEGIAESRGNLYGDGVVPVDETIAADLSTTEGIAGTVVEIRASTASTGSVFSARCTGVVVAQDRILTSAVCLTDPENPTTLLNAGQLSVAVSNDLEGVSPPEWTSDVSGVWIADPNVGPPAKPSDLAVLTLKNAIPEATVTNVAPVFLGDVEEALKSGVLVANDALVAGYGPECPSCSGASAVRRIGPLAGPVFIDEDSGSPWLASLLPNSPGKDLGAIFAESTDPWIDGLDRGGPLFLREAESGRYVVVGTYVKRHVGLSGDRYRFTFLGRVGNDPSRDHAEPIRQHLGKFIDGDPCGPGVRPTTVNSNFEAEWWWNKLGIAPIEEHIEDRCDPVPLMTFASAAPRLASAAPLEFTTRTWLGKGATTAEKSITARFGFCSCFNDYGNEFPERDCLESKCETISLQAQSANSPWAKLKVYHRAAPGSWTLTSLVPSGIREGQFGDDEVLKWDWHTDLSHGEIDGAGGVAVGFLGTSVDNAWVASNRDSRTFGYLRPTIVHLDLSPAPSFEPHPAVLLNRCIFVDCLPFIHPRDIYINVPFTSRIDIVNPVVIGVNQLGEVVAPRGDGVWQDISAAIDPSLNEALATAGTTWLSAVEGASALAAQGIDSRAALVTSTGKVLEVVATLDGLAVPSVGFAMAQMSNSPLGAMDSGASGAGGTVPSPLMQAEAAAVADISLPANGRALYSASEGVIYVVGDGSITKTELATGVSSNVVLDGPPPSGEILGAAYASGISTLYTLEATSGVQGEVRIGVYDVKNGAASVLWTAPYTAGYDFTSLSLTHEGEIILTAARNGTYTSWLIEAKPNGLPAFVGRLDRDGDPLDAPVMGALGPALPVLDVNGEVRMDSLDPREFRKGAPCTEL